VDSHDQDPWTEAQWTRVQETVRDEAKKARVAASFMAVQGPLPNDEQTAPLQRLRRPSGAATAGELLQFEDHETRRLTTLAVNVGLRGAQVAEADLDTALVAFRRAANLIARAEDYVVFRGQAGASPPAPAGLRPCDIRGGDAFLGLLPTALIVAQETVAFPLETGLVGAISRAVTRLEGLGHLGPFAVVLGHRLFDAAHSPLGTLVLPADRIRPLIDGPLLRSSWLNRFAVSIQVPSGIVVSLADNLLDLVVAQEISVRRLQVTVAPSPRHVYRVSERFTVRIKQRTALVALV
jgi:uncharacterized linocin/CFP29 family protein